MSQNVENFRGPVSPTGPSDEQAPKLTSVPEPGGSARRAGSSWWHSVWLVPVSAAVLGFLIYTLPPYLTFDPNQQHAPLNKSAPMLDYGFLVAHILFGTVALVTVCLQVWPWLRNRFPVFHRWTGRTYVFVGALPSALLALVVNYMHSGWHGDIGSYLQGGLLFVFTLIGYLAGRQGNYVKHRRWMLYSFAMCTSIVWGLIAALFWQYFAPKLDFNYVTEVSRWTGWLLNLLIIKWWLDRTERRSVRDRIRIAA